MIKLAGVTAGYGGAPVIRDINIHFHPGKVTAVIGPNGCGKTTLLKVAARLLAPTTGTVTVCGKNSKQYSPKEFARLVAVVPQARSVPPITAGEFVLYGRFPHLGFPRRPSGQHQTIVRQAMETVGAYADRDRLLSELSGGERQKVYLAMALAQDTPIILLDEPTTYLDINHQLEILRLIEQLREQGKTIGLVMHDLAQALSIADNVCLLQSGSVVICDTAEAVLKSGEIDRVFDVRSQTVQLPDGQTQCFFSQDQKVAALGL